MKILFYISLFLPFTAHPAQKNYLTPFSRIIRHNKTVLPKRAPHRTLLYRPHYPKTSQPWISPTHALHTSTRWSNQPQRPSTTTVFPLDLETKNEFGQTPLLVAAEQGNVQKVSLLLHAGANINAQDNDNNTALIYAVKIGNPKLITLLLQHPDLHINTQDAYGHSALIKASHHDNTAVAHTLLLHPKINVHTKDYDSYDALMHAAQNNNAALIQELFQRGASADTQDSTGATALIHAVRAQAPDAVQALLDHKAKVNQEDALHKTAFLYAAQQDDTTILNLMLVHPNFSLDAPNEYGETPLIRAMIRNDLDAITILIKYGANPLAQDNSGCNAYDYAHNDTQLFALLSKNSDKDTIPQPKHYANFTTLMQTPPVTASKQYMRLCLKSIPKKYAQAQDQGHIPLQKILNNEARYHKTHEVFYHAGTGSLRLYQDVLKKLYEKMNQTTTPDFIFTRFWTEATKKTNAPTFFASSDVSKKLCDALPHISKDLLCANPTLLSNHGKNLECSLDYFIDNTTFNPVDIKILLHNIFAHYNFDTRYLDQLMDLSNNSSFTQGTLLQIHIPKQDIDTMLYFTKSEPDFTDDPQTAISGCNTTFKVHTLPSKVLSTLHCGAIASSDLEKLQVRIHIAQDGMLNPNSGIKIFRYAHATPEKKQLWLEQEVGKIINSLYNDWVKKQANYVT